MRAWIALAVLVAGCSGNSGPSPGPSPVPPPTSFIGTVTDTVTGAPVSGFTALMAGSRVTVSAPGYVTRETSAGASTVDLIPEAGFDLTFYRQLVRGAAEGRMDALRRLTVSPSLYIHTAGLTDATVAAMVARAREVVDGFTGGHLRVATVETGPAPRAAQAGWVVVEIVSAPDETWCGTSALASPVGHIRLNTGLRTCARPLADTMAHELGHALGFYHVADTTALMSQSRPLAHVGAPSPQERYHAAIAYKRPVGSRDIDVDPVGGSSFTAGRVVVD